MDRQFRTAWTILAIIVAILGLAAADTSTRALTFEDSSLVVLGLSFIATMALMASVSIGARMCLSLQLITIYFAIYLILPGFNHSALNRFPFYNFSYPPEVRSSAAAMVALFLVAVIASYALAAQIARSAPKPVLVREVTMRANPALGLILTLASLLSLGLILTVLGLSQALATRTTENVSGLDIASTGLGVALPRILVFLPMIYAALLLRSGMAPRLGWQLLIVNLPIFLIVNFPLALSRTQAFGIVLLFAMLTVDFQRPSRRGLLSLCFVVGALIAMPLFDHFTRQGRTFSELDFNQLTSGYFSTGDFDGFQSINNAIVHVELYGLQYGLQLLSLILFFVPRAIWPDKAQPTGTITAESAGYSFLNISQPLPSEFFVDFGWLGVIVGGLLLGHTLSRLDHWLDRGWVVDMRTRLVAGWLMGFGLVILRGSLLSVLGPYLILAIGLWFVARFGMRRMGAEGRH